MPAVNAALPNTVEMVYLATDFSLLRTTGYPLRTPVMDPGPWDFDRLLNGRATATPFVIASIRDSCARPLRPFVSGPMPVMFLLPEPNLLEAIDIVIPGPHSGER